MRWQSHVERTSERVLELRTGFGVGVIGLRGSGVMDLAALHRAGTTAAPRLAVTVSGGPCYEAQRLEGNC